MKRRWRYQSSSRFKVVMAGPELSDQGGMAAVVHTCLDAWDGSRYQVKYVGTYNSNAIQAVKPLIAVRAFLHVLFLLLFWRPHILHLHCAAGVSFFRKAIFILLAKLTPVRVILHCHAPNFDVFYERRPRAVQAFIRRILNATDTLIVLSQYWQDFYKGLSTTVPIVTLYNSAVCPPESGRSNHDAPMVLSLGRLGWRKGTYDILKAIPAVLEQNPDTEFWLGGDGEVEQVRHMLSSEAWGERVRLLGWVRDREKAAALKTAKLFLLPSYQEGFPVAVLEAMAYGLPVISTPVGGIPELVVDGETGFLIEPGNVEALAEKITLLLNNPELRERMGARGRQRIKERFDTETMIKQLFAIYDSLTRALNGLPQDAHRSSV